MAHANIGIFLGGIWMGLLAIYFLIGFIPVVGRSQRVAESKLKSGKGPFAPMSPWRRLGYILQSGILATLAFVIASRHYASEVTLTSVPAIRIGLIFLMLVQISVALLMIAHSLIKGFWLRD
jgi:hypothetical protein